MMTIRETRIANTLRNVMNNYNVTDFDFEVTYFDYFTEAHPGTLEVTVFVDNTVNIEDTTLEDDIVTALEDEFEYEYDCYVGFDEL